MTGALPSLRSRPLLLLLLPLLLASACRKEEKVPEHIAQQRAREKAAEERARQRAPQPGGDAAIPGESWPREVQLAYLTLLGAPAAETREAARSLAVLGLKSAPALREIAVSASASQQKRELASLLLAELYLARPADLEALAGERRLPLARRAALESLVRLGRPAGEEALARVEAELRGRPDDAPLLRFLAEARRREKSPWGYDRAQLEVLDRLLQARSATELKVALGWVKDLSLQAGLERTLTLAVVPLGSQLIIAAQLARLAAERPGGLRALVRPGHAPLLRLAAARALADSGTAAERRLLEQLASDQRDPLAPALRKLLSRPATRPAP